jgi:type II secretory pathway pseudopilin PulG
MTLVEVIVAMAVISLVATAIVGAFVTAINISELSRTNAENDAGLEGQIASDAAANSTQELKDLKLGGYALGANAQTYNDGNSGYTLLEGVDKPQVQQWDFGDGAKNVEDISIDTGSIGGGIKLRLDPGVYRLEVWGARGGGTDLSSPAGANYRGGGYGGYATGTIRLTDADTILYLSAGGAGAVYDRTSPGEKLGGYNGGGNLMIGTTRVDVGGATGGGATDICIGLSHDLNTRVIVAGGGGGGGYSDEAAYSQIEAVVSGGNAGGEKGAEAATPNTNTPYANYVRGGGGTQTAGGAFIGNANASTEKPEYYATVGQFGVGGNGAGYADGGGGGGGGWYGGAGGCINGGGGGSSFVFTSASKPPSGYQLDSKYYLSDTNMISGGTLMPNPLKPGGANISGQPAGGYVRVTWLSY